MTSRSHTIRLRVSERERGQIEMAAEAAELTISEYIRRAIIRDVVEEADVGGGSNPRGTGTHETPATTGLAAADVSPGLTAKEWDRKVRQGDHTLPVATRRRIVEQQYGPRPKEEE